MIESTVGTTIKLDSDDRLLIIRSQDVEDILRVNRALRCVDDGFSADRTWRRLAQIPNVVVEQWLNEGVNVFDRNCDAEVKRRLNSGEWAFLRTSPGRV